MKLHQSYCIVLLCLTFSIAQSLQAQSDVKKKAFESLKKMFGDSISITQQQIILSPKENDTIFQQAKTQWKSDTVQSYLCTVKGKPVGFGFVDNVKGKVQFITYLVGLTSQGEVKDVDVLVYRESYGSEIMYDSFRKQFRNKTATDPIYPGKDIKNISGATISVRAITLGVKRVVTTFPLIKNRMK